MKKLIKVSAPVLVLLVGVLVVVGLGAAKPEPEKNDDAPRLVSLYVEEVTSDEVQVSVKTQGEVRPKTEIELVPQVSGRIVAMSENFNQGAQVQAGAMLLRIDDADYRLAVIRAEGRVAEARTQLEREQATAQIKAEEWRDGRASGEPTPFALNLTQVAQAEANLRATEADLQRARLDLERTVITVPFDGRVRERLVSIGQTVSVGTPLGRVFSVDTVEVMLSLTDAQLGELELPLGYMAETAGTGPVVDFYLQLGSKAYHWQGHIVRVDAAVDSNTRLIYATAEVEDPYGVAANQGMPLAVGLFVNAEIGAVAERQALVLPRLALHSKDKVYVINADNRLEIRTVEVISTSEERVLVATGVEPGEHVVTSTLPNAVDGMEVEPIFREAGKG